jgi:hypothetical protein
VRSRQECDASLKVAGESKNNRNTTEKHEITIQVGMLNQHDPYDSRKKLVIMIPFVAEDEAEGFN